MKIKIHYQRWEEEGKETKYFRSGWVGEKKKSSRGEERSSWFLQKHFSLSVKATKANLSLSENDDDWREKHKIIYLKIIKITPRRVAREDKTHLINSEITFIRGPSERSFLSLNKHFHWAWSAALFSSPKLCICLSVSTAENCPHRFAIDEAPEWKTGKGIVARWRFKFIG